MTAYPKQDSNRTSLALGKETSLGVTDSNTVWNTREVNDYKDLGGTFKLLAREPIVASRQSRKGVITDLDANGGWQEDLTYIGVQQLIEGVMFAAFRKKRELACTGVGGAAHDYLVAAGGAVYTAGTLLFAKGFVNPLNNGLHKVASSTSGTVVVTDTGHLVDESSTSGIISCVGVEGGSGDITFDVTGGVSSLLSTTFDFTTLGLVPGEWVHVGDDGAGTSFTTVGCNGFKRVLTVAAHKMTFDKSVKIGAATDAGTGDTVRVFIARYLKNESDPTLIVRSTYAIERQLGYAATDSAFEQAEYVNGNVLDKCLFTFNSADKITYEITTLGTTYNVNDSATGPRAGVRPALLSGSAYNTSVDLVHTGISVVGTGVPLYAYLTDMAFTIDNNSAPDKALSVLGAFDITPGGFSVTGTATGYFADVDAQSAIIHNKDVTVEVIMARDNSGIVLDIPLCSLGNGLLKVASNKPITLPLNIDAASNSSLNAGSDYTASLSFFDYLPNFAMGTGN